MSQWSPGPLPTSIIHCVHPPARPTARATAKDHDVSCMFLCYLFVALF